MAHGVSTRWAVTARIGNLVRRKLAPAADSKTPRPSVHAAERVHVGTRRRSLTRRPSSNDGVQPEIVGGARSSISARAPPPSLEWNDRLRRLVGGRVVTEATSDSVHFLADLLDLALSRGAEALHLVRELLARLGPT